MELMQLEMFVAVVEERNFARAAERVFRTQPAVSIGLRKLEEELGVPLLDRSKRNGYRLTRAGEYLYESASRMVALEKEMISRLRGKPVSCVGHLSVGFSLEKSVVSELYARFAAANPNARMEIFTGESERLLRDLADRNLDAAFVPGPSEQEASMRGFAVHRLAVVRSADGVYFVLPKTGRSHTLRMFEEMVLSQGERRARGVAGVTPRTMRTSFSTYRRKPRAERQA